MFYKLVHFAREGQESVSLRFMMETQWPLGSGGTAVPSQWDSRSVDSLVGQGAGASASFTWVSAQGRLQREGARADVNGVESSGWKVTDFFSEAAWPLGAERPRALKPQCLRRRGKKSSAPWRQQCKTKWLWMEQLTGNIFHLQLHVEVISPNKLKLLENCRSNGK